MEYGRLRKNIEVKLSREMGMDINENQVKLIRLYAVKVAEAKITVEDALYNIRNEIEPEKE